MKTFDPNVALRSHAPYCPICGRLLEMKDLTPSSPRWQIAHCPDCDRIVKYQAWSQVRP